MRKQNSTFKTAFISEAGSELKNNDYFAFVELERYACYVVADGLNDVPGAESARLAVQTILIAFQERPSMRKRTIRSWLEAADRALAEADDTQRLKASVIVVVTDYVKLRYAQAGNTRLRLYRNGIVREQTSDASLGMDMVRERNLPQDVLARHEQRNNLRTYLGKGRSFLPFISGKIKLENGDIVAMYTRGIWENLDGGELDDVFSEAKDDPQESLDDIEELLLSKQPGQLENYTFATVFVDKVFLDPDRKRRIRKIVTISVLVFVLLLVLAVVLWFLARQRRRRVEDMELHYTNMTEYIQDSNYIRAQEECTEALDVAGKLRDKEKMQEISDYRKLIEAVNAADKAFGEGKYEEAHTAYMASLERSRYADRIADAYIHRKLAVITDYLSVFDYMQMGDQLSAQGDYSQAEEKYLQARNLATGAYFEEGRQAALDALEALYESQSKAEEADKEAAREKAADETGAVSLAAEGDKAFAEGEYESANAYYTMALEKYQEMGDDVHAAGIQARIDASTQKSEETKEKRQKADDCVERGKTLEARGNYLEARKEYQSAGNLYRELKLEDETKEVDGLLEMLDTVMAIEAEKRAKEEAERAAILELQEQEAKQRAEAQKIQETEQTPQTQAPAETGQTPETQSTSEAGQTPET